MLVGVFITDTVTMLFEMLPLQDIWKLYRLCRGGPFQRILRSFFEYGGMFHKRIIDLIHDKLPKFLDDSKVEKFSIEHLCHWFTLYPKMTKIYQRCNARMDGYLPKFLTLQKRLEFTVDDACHITRANYIALDIGSIIDYQANFKKNMNLYYKLFCCVNSANQQHLTRVCGPLFQALGRRQSVFTLGQLKHGLKIIVQGSQIMTNVTDVLNAGFSYHEQWLVKMPLEDWFVQLQADVQECYKTKSPTLLTVKMEYYQEKAPIRYILKPPEAKRFQCCVKHLKNWADVLHKRLLRRQEKLLRRREKQRQTTNKKRKRDMLKKRRKREKQKMADLNKVWKIR